MGLNRAPHPPNLANGFVRPHRSPRITRGHKGAIAIMIVLIVYAIIILPAIRPGEHTSTIERNAGSTDEMRAIQTAEDIDMAQVLGIDRFGRSSMGGFRWSYVADGETIDFYQDLIEEMDRKWDQDDASFEYVAECQYVDRVLLFPSEGYGENWLTLGTMYSMESSNANADFESQFRYLNLGDIPRAGESYLLEGAYIIRQHLSFDLWLTDEYHQVIEQLVILDGDLDLRVLMVDPDHREIPICE